MGMAGEVVWCARLDKNNSKKKKDQGASRHMQRGFDEGLSGSNRRWLVVIRALSAVSQSTMSHLFDVTTLVSRVRLILKTTVSDIWIHMTDLYRHQLKFLRALNRDSCHQFGGMHWSEAALRPTEHVPVRRSLIQILAPLLSGISVFSGIH